jgi:hypothetical protein
MSELNRNVEQVKKMYGELEKLTNEDYRSFELALLIMQRLDYLIGKDDITQELVDKVSEVADYDGSMLNDNIVAELDIIANEIEEKESEE